MWLFLMALGLSLLAWIAVCAYQEVNARTRNVNFLNDLRIKASSSSFGGRLGAPVTFNALERVAWYLICHTYISNVFELDDDHEDPFTPQEWRALNLLCKLGIVTYACDGGGLCEWRFSPSTGSYYIPFNL